jgi:rubrerythrin
MKDFESINDILDFAIENEQKAVDFYNQLAASARNDEMRKTFEQFAREEMGHKAKILNIKEQGILSFSKADVADLKIADYVVRTETETEVTYEQALVLAMKREKAAFKLYLKLSEKAPTAEIKSLFLALAQEESRHKLRFEIEYNDYFLKEN